MNNVQWLFNLLQKIGIFCKIPSFLKFFDTQSQSQQRQSLTLSITSPAYIRLLYFRGNFGIRWINTCMIASILDS